MCTVAVDHYQDRPAEKKINMPLLCSSNSQKSLWDMSHCPLKSQSYNSVLPWYSQEEKK